MRYFGKTLCPWYTDLALVVGPNVRWTEDDVEDLVRWYPEVLLGYRVRTMTVDSLRHGGVRGMRPAKIIVLDGCQRQRGWQDAWVDLKFAEANNPDCKIEYWHVHRATGIFKMDFPWGDYR